MSQNALMKLPVINEVRLEGTIINITTKDNGETACATMYAGKTYPHVYFKGKLAKKALGLPPRTNIRVEGHIEGSVSSKSVGGMVVHKQRIICDSFEYGKTDIQRVFEDGEDIIKGAAPRLYIEGMVGHIRRLKDPVHKASEDKGHSDQTRVLITLTTAELDENGKQVYNEIKAICASSKLKKIQNESVVRVIAELNTLRRQEANGKYTYKDEIIVTWIDPVK